MPSGKQAKTFGRGRGTGTGGAFGSSTGAVNGAFSVPAFGVFSNEDDNPFASSQPVSKPRTNSNSGIRGLRPHDVNISVSDQSEADTEKDSLTKSLVSKRKIPNEENNHKKKKEARAASPLSKNRNTDSPVSFLSNDSMSVSAIA